jgi:hypothetical protein
LSRGATVRCFAAIATRLAKGAVVAEEQRAVAGDTELPSQNQTNRVHFNRAELSQTCVFMEPGYDWQSAKTGDDDQQTG